MTDAFHDGFSRDEYLSGEGNGISIEQMGWREHAELSRQGTQILAKLVEDPDIDDDTLGLADARVEYHYRMATLGWILDEDANRPPVVPTGADRRPKRERGARP